MKKKLALALAASLAALCLSGCERILQRDFYYEEAHAAGRQGLPEASAGAIGSYDSLREALLNAASQAMPSQTLRLEAYDGEPEADLQRISKELTEQVPLGVYAIASIVYEHSRVLFYHNIHVTFQYRKTPEQIRGLTRVINQNDYDRRVNSAIQNRETFLLLETEYDEKNHGIARVMQMYYNSGNSAYGLDSASLSVFPESGSRRILEITFSYQESAPVSAVKALAAERTALDILEELRAETEGETVLNIHNWLVTAVEYDRLASAAALDERGTQPKTDPYTAYGAIVMRKAAAEGFALACAKLCAVAGIECIVVTGTQNGLPAVWNMVNIDGEWYHMDCGADAQADSGFSAYDTFLLTDEQIGELRKIDEGIMRPRSAQSPPSQQIQNGPVEPENGNYENQG